MVSYYVILLTATEGGKLIPQSYLTDTYDNPAKVTLVLDHLVTDKLHVTPSIGTVTPKIYLHGRYHSAHSYKTLLLWIIVLSGDIELVDLFQNRSDKINKSTLPKYTKKIKSIGIILF